MVLFIPKKDARSDELSRVNAQLNEATRYEQGELSSSSLPRLNPPFRSDTTPDSKSAPPGRRAVVPVPSKGIQTQKHDLHSLTRSLCGYSAQLPVRRYG